MVCYKDGTIPVHEGHRSRKPAKLALHTGKQRLPTITVHTNVSCVLNTIHIIEGAVNTSEKTYVTMILRWENFLNIIGTTRVTKLTDVAT